MNVAITTCRTSRPSTLWPWTSWRLIRKRRKLLEAMNMEGPALDGVAVQVTASHGANNYPGR